MLPREIHHKSMGMLLDIVCEHVIKAVLVLSDISEDEVRQCVSTDAYR